jgi:LmbE family N-acetylglucosaminyl deacetylase
MRSILIVSPHLDDAVLSLGGAIAHWVAGGTRVRVATINTVGPELANVAPDLRKWADYPARLEEDRAACDVLGVERSWLGHVERVWRVEMPPMGFYTLPDVLATAPIVASLDALDRPDLVLAPLGIGNHVDHVEAMVATAEWAASRDVPVQFYEDFYALSATLREAHPVAQRWTWSADANPLAAAPELAAIFERIAVARGGTPIERLYPALEGGWNVETVPVDEPRGLEAIAKYPSQTAAFGGFDGIAATIRAYHAFWGGEPLWKPAGN